MQCALQNDATHNTTRKEALMTVTDFVSERFFCGTSSGVVSIKELMDCVVFLSMCAAGAAMIFILQWRRLPVRCATHPAMFGVRGAAASRSFEKSATRSHVRRRTRFTVAINWKFIADRIQPDRYRVCRAFYFPAREVLERVSDAGYDVGKSDDSVALAITGAPVEDIVCLVDRQCTTVCRRMRRD